ncbi:MAG: type II secretion system protein GspM [Proteobacteria bacterium]|nr:type II secretion system protein GspM [Pseudomonadota bacterium]
MAISPSLLKDKNPEMDKWYALLILTFVVVMVYYVAFQGFVSEHTIMNEELSELQQNRVEYSELEAMIPELQKRINIVKETVGDNTNFLVSDTDNLGKAELTRILKGIVAQNTDVSSACQTINHTPSKDREPDQFEKIILKVRMRCQFDKMIGVLADIEKHVPHLFVDNLQLEQRAIRRSRKNVAPTKPMLEVRFDLYAYMNKPVRSKDKKDERGRRP